MTPRSLIIGLDGATFDLIDPLIEAGCLPTISQLIKDGVRASLESWPNMNSAAAWSSMVTGYNPGEHGIYDFGGSRDVVEDPDRGWRPTIGADRKRDAFWRLLSAAGQAVGIINLPMSYPADRVNGFMLAGMDAPSVHSPGFAHPPELFDELRAKGIEYLIDTPSLMVLSNQDPLRLPKQVQHVVEVRAKAIQYLMRHRDWDVLMAVFVSTDRVQHAYWPDTRAPVESPTWTPIRTLYQQIDRALEEILALKGENTNVFLVSDHGFTNFRPAAQQLNWILEKAGLVHRHERTGNLGDAFLQTLLKHGRQRLPFRLQYPLARFFPELHLRAVNAARYSYIDWSRTQAFATLFEGSVSVNLAGREVRGTVAQGDYERICNLLHDLISNLQDPTTGSQVALQVSRREELYHGPYAAKSADLYFRWNYDVLADALRCSLDGKVLVTQPSQPVRSTTHYGMHHPQGIFVATGPQIKKGKRIPNPSLYDIAPTILYVQGQPISSDMDGKVLESIFVEGHLKKDPVRLNAPTPPTADSKPILDRESEQLIEKRLRDLGYIE